MASTDDRLVKLYADMSELTKPECGKTCRRPHSCCQAENCADAERWAKDEWGITLVRTGHPKLPFMGPEGCVVPPHLRPICTVHTCEVNSLGFKAGDPAWTAKYFKIRNEIDEIEWRRSEAK